MKNDVVMKQKIIKVPENNSVKNQKGHLKIKNSDYVAEDLMKNDVVMKQKIIKVPENNSVKNQKVAVNNLLKYVDKNFMVNNAEEKSERVSAAEKEADD